MKTLVCGSYKIRNILGSLFIYLLPKLILIQNLRKVIKPMKVSLASSLLFLCLSSSFPNIAALKNPMALAFLLSPALPVLIYNWGHGIFMKWASFTVGCFMNQALNIWAFNLKETKDYLLICLSLLITFIWKNKNKTKLWSASA